MESLFVLSSERDNRLLAYMAVCICFAQIGFLMKENQSVTFRRDAVVLLIALLKFVILYYRMILLIANFNVCKQMNWRSGFSVSSMNVNFVWMKRKNGFILKVEGLVIGYYSSYFVGK